MRLSLTKIFFLEPSQNCDYMKIAEKKSKFLFCHRSVLQLFVPVSKWRQFDFKLQTKCRIQEKKSYCPWRSELKRVCFQIFWSGTVSKWSPFEDCRNNHN